MSLLNSRIKIVNMTINDFMPPNKERKFKTSKGITKEKCHKCNLYYTKLEDYHYELGNGDISFTDRYCKKCKRERELKERDCANYSYCANEVKNIDPNIKHCKNCIKAIELFHRLCKQCNNFVCHDKHYNYCEKHRPGDDYDFS